MFKVEKLDRSFGAKVFAIALTDIQEDEMQELYQLWLEHALLIFPGQNLSNEEQVEFAKRFGDLEFDLSPISNVRTDGYEDDLEPMNELVEALKEPFKQSNQYFPSKGVENASYFTCRCSKFSTSV